MIQLLAASLLSLQGGSPQADESWVLLDGVAAVVNDDIVTEVELSREAKNLREFRGVSITTPDELIAFEERVLEAVVIRRLGAQAGRELGLGEEDVERVVDSHLGNLRRRLGLLTYIDDLESRGLGEGDVHTETRRQFYRETWESSVVGEGTAGQRPRRDRYVRPGEMYYIYGEVQHLLGPPPEIRLRQFALEPEKGQGDEELYAACKVLRDRAQEGESLEELVREIGLERSAVRAWTVPADRIESDDLRAFATNAPPGTLSEVVLATTDKDRTQAAFFVLDDRRAAGLPRPFLSGTVQTELSKRALAERDRWNLVRGQLELIEGSYIDPPLAKVEPTPGG